LKASCDHPEINDRLLLCLDRVLPAPEQEATLLHARDCVVCSEELRQLQEIAGVVKNHAAAIADVCVAPEMLVACAEDRPVSPATYAAIQAHLASCDACAGHYAMLKALGAATLPQPDPRAVSSSEKNFLRLAARWYPATPQPASELAADLLAAAAQWKERLLEWLRALVPLQSQMVMVRKGRRKAGENIAVITERFRGIAVRIEIEPLGPDQVELMVFVSAPGKKKVPEGLRVSLFHDGRERTSLIVRNGKALFKRLPHHTYELAISWEGTILKRITFKTT
jgi:hypothetical protein